MTAKELIFWQLYHILVTSAIITVLVLTPWYISIPIITAIAVVAVSH
jgi:hypothetical protein